MRQPEVLRHRSAADLAEAAAARCIATMVQVQAAGGEPRIVLTGGGIGTAVLAAMAESPGRDSIDWGRVDIWWGDERFLPTGDPDRNQTSAEAALLARVPVDRARVHAIPGPDRSATVEEAASRYAASLAAAARPEDHGCVPAFDILMLGIGPEGHIASIFPESPAAHERERTVVAVHGSPKPPPTRVTLTFPAINAARQVWIMASGVEKARAVRLLLDPAAGPLQVPAAGVKGREQTLILVDDAAAELLPTSLGRPEA